MRPVKQSRFLQPCRIRIIRQRPRCNAFASLASLSIAPHRSAGTLALASSIGLGHVGKRLQGGASRREILGAPPAGGRLALDRDRPGGSGLDMFELDDSRADRAKTAGRGIGLDRVRESEFVGPMPDGPKRIGRERLLVPIMFRKSVLEREETRAEGLNAGLLRLRSAEAGEIAISD